MSRPLHDPRKEEVFDLKGDPQHGFSSDLHLTKTALGKVEIRYKDRLSVGEVYPLVPGQPERGVWVHFYCPRCTNPLRIASDRKDIEYDQATGLISIEPFECTWEMGRSDATRDDRIVGGAGLCRWRVGVVNNIARDA